MNLKFKKEDLNFVNSKISDCNTIRDCIYLIRDNKTKNGLLKEFEKNLFDICFICDINFYSLANSLEVTIPQNYNITDFGSERRYFEPLEKIFFKIEFEFFGEDYNRILSNKFWRDYQREKGEDL